MVARILFAEPQDEFELSEILMEYGMGFPGEIEDQVIVKENERVVAGAKVVEYEKRRFFLEVLGVKQDSLRQGIGRLLMTEIVRNPWECCKNLLSQFEPQESYHITTVARGYATDFYINMGFKAFSFLELPEPYREQCSECPDKEDCKPISMKYIGGI